MNQDINKRVDEKEKIKMAKKQNIIKYIKYFLSVVKIQRSFRKFKVKCTQNVVYEHQMAKAVNNKLIFYLIEKKNIYFNLNK